MKICFVKEVGWDGSVGTATRYGLDGPGIESRWREEFCAFPTRPEAHPASCTEGTCFLPPELKRRGAWFLLPTRI
jgi:hypothetical protein